MSTTETRALIEGAVEGLQREVPALAQLTLVARVELRTHGGDTPIWRVEVPGPKVTKESAADAKIDLSIGRPEFNSLAKEGHLAAWIDAYERGHLRVSGEPGVVRLIGNVIQKQQQRTPG